ncbi:hypothetical protein VTN77DRAFT_4989 [Rasamsonia byssochlamydoides]|uniref:uncharacterized protein n=1 Tax=Rasamsonia byssochlamydoides TaxID=89139 RepID=UPI003742E267
MLTEYKDLTDTERKMLLNLPLELLVAIISELTDRKDLKNVCEVSKHLYSATAPILYQSVSVLLQRTMIYSTILKWKNYCAQAVAKR